MSIFQRYLKCHPLGSSQTAIVPKNGHRKCNQRIGWAPDTFIICAVLLEDIKSLSPPPPPRIPQRHIQPEVSAQLRAWPRSMSALSAAWSDTWKANDNHVVFGYGKTAPERWETSFVGKPIERHLAGKWERYQPGVWKKESNS